MNVSQIFNNFSAGEVSPLLMARTDTAQYNNGASRIFNFLPLLTGGVRKRPGSWYDGAPLGAARLVSFQLSDGTYVQVEFSALKARYWTASYALFGAPLETSTTYAAADLPYLRVAVSKNVLWIVHALGTFAPKRITWNGSTFTLDAPTFTGEDFAAAGKYPSGIAFDAGRLWFSRGNGIWGSKPPNSSTGADQYQDFTIGATSADAIYLQENDMYGSNLRWIAANRLMIAGTDRAVWCDTGDVPTPATFDMNIVSSAGSSSLQPVGSRDVMVYIGRSGKSLHALVFQSTSDGGQSLAEANLSTASDHMLISGVVDIAVMDYPLPIVWMALTDGTLVSCTLNLSGGMIAFASHEIDTGNVESISVGPGATGDVLWMIVNRAGTRSVEHILFPDLIGVDFDESHFVDSGVRLTYGSPTSTIAGLTRLAGKTVAAFADGALLPPKVVSAGGEVVYDRAVSLIHIGLPYDSYLEPITQEFQANGTSQGKKRKIEKATLKLYGSLGGKVGISEDKLQPLLYAKYGSTEYGAATDPYTGFYDLTLSGTIDTEARCIVKHSEPVPFTILALILRIVPMES